MKSVSRSLLPLFLLGACAKPPAIPVYQAVAAQKRDITVTAQASGAINADTVVQVKSKASGEILDIKVQTGDVVKRGTLMLQVDQRIPANQVATAQAALQVDSAQLANAKSQLKRQQELFAARAVTQQELETAQLAVAQANASVVRDGINLDDAKIAMGDTEVRAPITGTVIEQAVQRGTVISSPTNSASGGTALLTMADLANVQVRTWVDETDIGKIHQGMDANVTVAAYPNRPFKGIVAKIEPQADTIQNVTMFPVLVNIDNKDNLLKPGMNADVKMAVGSRIGVLAIPNAALRTEKDVASAGSVLGISPTDLATMLVDAKKVMADASAQKADTSAGVPLPNPAAGATGGQGRSGTAPSDSQGARRGRRNGGDSASGGRGRRNGGDSANAGNGGGRQGGGNAGGGGAGRGGNNGGGGNGAGGADAAGGGGGGRGRGGRGGGKTDYSFGGRFIVFAMKNGKPKPVYIQTGLTDLDYSEVKMGLVEGDSVLLLPSASLVAQQAQMQARQAANAGLPGQAKPAGTTAGGAAGGGGGGGGGGRGGRGGP